MGYRPAVTRVGTFRSVLLIAGVALVLVACGGEGGNQATNAPTAAGSPRTTTAPATSAPPAPTPAPTVVPPVATTAAPTPGVGGADTSVCTVVDAYIGSLSAPVASSPAFSEFLVALQDSGLAGITPFIDGPVALGAPLTVFMGSASGESILRYDVTSESLTGPQFMGGGPGGTDLPAVDLPGPQYAFDVGNSGYRLIDAGGQVLCSSPFGG